MVYERAYIDAMPFMHQWIQDYYNVDISFGNDESNEACINGS